jgi:hypothetical protein
MTKGRSGELNNAPSLRQYQSELTIARHSVLPHNQGTRWSKKRLMALIIIFGQPGV